jgi:hypothetical protein
LRLVLLASNKPGLISLNKEFTAVVKKEEGWWIGWVEEVLRCELPGALTGRAVGNLKGYIKGSS